MAMNVRLDEGQTIAVQERAERYGTNASAALRELVDLGRLLESAESGIVVTPAARELIADGDALVRFAAGPDDHAERVLGTLGLVDVELQAVLDGALLICTAEEFARLTGGDDE
jgi:hypothetical protein